MSWCSSQHVQRCIVAAGGGAAYLAAESFAARRRCGRALSCDSCAAAEARTLHSFTPHVEPIRLPQGFQLKAAVALVRHGDRSPINPYRAGPALHVSEAFWRSLLPSAEEQAAWQLAHPKRLWQSDEALRRDDAQKPTPFGDAKVHEGEVGFWKGQLTPTGAGECLEIGKMLGTRYADALGLKNSRDRVAAFSTNLTRTVQSAQNVLLGMSSALPVTCSLRGVPVYVRQPSEETLVPNGDGKNTRFTAAVSRAQEEQMPAFLQRYGALEQRLKTSLGLRVDEIMSWAVVREVLTCYQLYGCDFPVGIGEAELNELMTANAKLWGGWYQDPEVAMFAVGRLMYDICEFLGASLGHQQPQQASSSVSSAFGREPRLLILSAHDGSLIPLLSFLGCYTGEWPPYGSVLLMELAVDGSGQPFIRFVLNDEEQRVSFKPFPRVMSR
eukprot:TRINITY_DN17821_c0_g1_i3.p1 TRINITY_DN17821_c0_g1~~TRINITY_DN17821_c0_g1_i3.p1  ORF type:complete len:465 (-),score=53.35 TRINITY_DN17821_c0_g1_i3:963-2285(-)